MRRVRACGDLEKPRQTCLHQMGIRPSLTASATLTRILAVLLLQTRKRKAFWSISDCTLLWHFRRGPLWEHICRRFCRNYGGRRPTAPVAPAASRVFISPLLFRPGVVEFQSLAPDLARAHAREYGLRAPPPRLRRDDLRTRAPEAPARPARRARHSGTVSRRGDGVVRSVPVDLYRPAGPAGGRVTPLQGKVRHYLASKEHETAGGQIWRKTIDLIRHGSNGLSGDCECWRTGRQSAT
jgi:hypothetical protein